MKSRENPLDEAIRLPDILPVLPLKDAVLYPFIIVPLSLGRESSIRAVDQSLAENRMVLLVAQRDAKIEEPEQSDLYQVGTAASITTWAASSGSMRSFIPSIICWAATATSSAQVSGSAAASPRLARMRRASGQ